MNSRIHLFLVYLVAFIASAGATLLTMGIFYFTANRWGWNARQNLAFAATQSAVYTVSALFAHAVSSRWGRRKSLVGLYALMTLISTAAALTTSHAVVCGCLLLYMFFVGMTWPMVESLCSESPDPHVMSRRIGIYNVTWAVSGTAALFLTGLLIERWNSGIFIAAVLLHGPCALLMLWVLLASPEMQKEAAPHLSPEPELLRSRQLALWLSRIALPAMYVVNFGLSAILPLLSVMRQFTPAWQTLYGSIWVVSRMAMFAILAATAFWHTRPRLLLVASAIMLVSFFMITLAPSQFIDARISAHADLLSMILAQILLGIAMALIYMASLYFGMVLSQSSTAHGGYHEALIGLGGILGPGAGALTQTLFPDNLLMAILAVGGVVGASVLAAAVASLVIRKSTSRAISIA